MKDHLPPDLGGLGANKTTESKTLDKEGLLDIFNHDSKIFLKTDLFILERENMNGGGEAEGEGEADPLLSMEPNLGLIPGP